MLHTHDEKMKALQDNSQQLHAENHFDAPAVLVSVTEVAQRYVFNDVHVGT